MKPDSKHTWRHRLHEIIYEADTAWGRVFDIILLFLIVLSVLMVCLESVDSINQQYREIFNYFEWGITFIFTIEYLLRLLVVRKPLNYVFSFYGIIDLLSTLPKYISLFMVGTHSLIALRALRLLRMFRILKLTRYIGASNTLMKALLASRAKIGVFLFSVLVLCVIFGTIMYMIESDKSGFTSIPRSIYWCIVTLTTVGYGDIAPATSLGQFIASLIMVLGYGIIAVPTGIVTAEMTEQSHTIDTNTQMCKACMNPDHKDDAMYCHQCGEILNDET